MSTATEKLRAILAAAESDAVTVPAELLAEALDEAEKQKALHDKLWQKNLQNHVMQITRAHRAFDDPTVKGANAQANALKDAVGIKGRRKKQNRANAAYYAWILLGVHPHLSLTDGPLAAADSRREAHAKKRKAVELLVASKPGETYASMRQSIVRGIEEDRRRQPEDRLSLDFDLQDFPFPPWDYETLP